MPAAFREMSPQLNKLATLLHLNGWARKHLPLHSLRKDAIPLPPRGRPHLLRPPPGRHPRWVMSPGQRDQTTVGLLLLPRGRE